MKFNCVVGILLSFITMLTNAVSMLNDEDQVFVFSWPAGL